MSHGTLQAPQERPQNVPEAAQWLGGIGAGAYFHVEVLEDNFQISRWDLEGHLDCSREMHCQTSGFDIQSDYQFDYPCHCAEANIIQNGKQFKFLWEGNPMEA
jgi:hypothetical protein